MTDNSILPAVVPAGHLTVHQVAGALPASLRSSATQSLVDRINNISTDPIIAENIRENFMSYTKVIKDGRFKTSDYLNAVSYVSFKLMGYSNQDAYERAFPVRHAALVARGSTRKDISAYVAAYHKNKLVNLIMEQTLTPVHILNQGIYQEAINVQASLMQTANSEKVRSDAADSLLNHLKKPEDKGMNLNIGISEDTGLKELRAKLGELADKQKSAIENGATTTEIAAEPMYAGEEDDIEEAEFTPVDG